jgi:Yip1 domain
MLNSLIAKMKGFIVTPVEMFRQSRADELRTVLAYFIPLLLFDAIMTAIVALLESIFFPRVVPGYFGPLLPVIMFVGVLIGGAIILLIFTAWVHLLVFAAGGRKGIFQTFKALTYGLTQSCLLHWIPLIGIVFDLWSIVLMILGIRELQEISSSRALVVMIIAVMVPLAILILIAMYLYIAMASQTVPAAPLNLF